MNDDRVVVYGYRTGDYLCQRADYSPEKRLRIRRGAVRTQANAIRKATFYSKLQWANKVGESETVAEKNYGRGAPAQL